MSWIASLDQKPNPQSMNYKRNNDGSGDEKRGNGKQTICIGFITYFK